MEDHAPVVDPAHHGHDVLRIERRRQVLVSHRPPRAVGDLGVLHVETRAREQRHVAGVVVVHVRDDDILHFGGIDSHGGKSVGNRTQQRAPAAGGCGRVKARVHDDAVCIAPDQPHVIIERHRLGMVVAAEKIVVAGAIQVPVADGVDPVRHHSGPQTEASEPPSTCRISPFTNDAASLSR